MFPHALVDIAAVAVDHRARVRAHPDSLRRKLASNQLTMSAFDAHAHGVLHGWSAALALRSCVHLVCGCVNVCKADPRPTEDKMGMAMNHFAGASILGVSALAVRSLAGVLPRRQRSQLKPKEQALLRDVEALRDAKSSGEGLIVPPKDALRRSNTPIPSSSLTFVATCPADGSRWKATRLP
jgi:hypothetical protein